MGKFLAGTLFGLVLSVSYVWYDISLPGWIELPAMFQRSLTAAAIDETLFDPDAPKDMRRRALEVYFANQAKRAAAIEEDLGHPILREIERRRVRRAAQILRGLWSNYDKLLAKPPLRAATERKHGKGDDDTLKRRMLLAALRKEPYLLAWITRHRGAPGEANVREVLIEVSRLRREP